MSAGAWSPIIQVCAAHSPVGAMPHRWAAISKISGSGLTQSASSEMTQPSTIGPSPVRRIFSNCGRVPPLLTIPSVHPAARATRSASMCRGGQWMWELMPRR